VKIPATVKVGAMTYDIVKADGVLRKFDGTEMYGSIDYNAQVIRLSGDERFSAQTAQLTLWHELFHAFTKERGIEWGENDELYTEELAKAMHAFCVDNGLDFVGAK
jgi:Zn-dependent peptidase ImmA (M78 family)